MEGKDTLALPGREHTDTHQTLTDFRDWVILNRDNPLIQLTTNIGELVRNVVDFWERMLSIPNLPRPVPEIGWLGVTALAAWIAYAIANWRIALLVTASFVSFGLLGFWEDSIDLLIVTFLAVGVTVVVGIPLDRKSV